MIGGGTDHKFPSCLTFGLAGNDVKNMLDLDKAFKNARCIRGVLMGLGSKPFDQEITVSGLIRGLFVARSKAKVDPAVFNILLGNLRTLKVQSAVL